MDTFKSQPNDQDLSSYDDPQLEDILVRASAKCDAIMGRSFLPQEVTEFFRGNGDNVLNLDILGPIIYVNSIALVMPGFAPFQLPLGQLLIDYQRGVVRSYSAMIWQTLGVTGTFPRNGLPISVNYAYGKGFPIPPPAFALSAGPQGGTLTPAAQYDVAVTSRTQSGESRASAIQTFTVTSTGSILVAITHQPGAMLHRVYAALHGQQLKLVSESPATAYGTQSLDVTLLSLTPGPNLMGVDPPAADSSAWPLDMAIVEATRILALSIIWEQNNKANRGYNIEESGKKRISWRSTDGTSGKGTPVPVQEADVLLAPCKFCGIF